MFTYESLSLKPERLLSNKLYLEASSPSLMLTWEGPYQPAICIIIYKE